MKHAKDFMYGYLNCANCGKLEEDAYYAASSGFMSFVCEKCKKINWISTGFHTKIVSKEKEKELYRLNGFS